MNLNFKNKQNIKSDETSYEISNEQYGIGSDEYVHYDVLRNKENLNKIRRESFKYLIDDKSNSRLDEMLNKKLNDSRLNEMLNKSNSRLDKSNSNSRLNDSISRLNDSRLDKSKSKLDDSRLNNTLDNEIIVYSNNSTLYKNNTNNLFNTNNLYNNISSIDTNNTFNNPPTNTNNTHSYILSLSFICIFLSVLYLFSWMYFYFSKRLFKKKQAEIYEYYFRIGKV